MRWFVEVSRVGENGVADEYCVEAKQWQAALQEARKLRGDTGALSKFSIELLDRGYRAVDPSLKLRYLINEAPPDAPLTGSGESSNKNGNKAEASGKHRVTESLAPSAYATSLAPTPFTTSLAPPGASTSSSLPRPASHPTSASVPAPRLHSFAPPRVATIEPPRASQLTVPNDPVPPAPALPGSQSSPPPSFAPRVPLFELVRQRAEEPRPDSPITYREFAYAVEPGRTRGEIEALLRDRYQATLAAIEDRPPGKFVQLAVFDHVFKRRPERPPLATFAWKDWRGEPVFAFPGFGEEAMAPMSRVPPARESVPPARESVPPARESVPPPSNGVPASIPPQANNPTALLLPPSFAPASREPVPAKVSNSIVPMAPVVIASAPPPPAPAVDRSPAPVVEAEMQMVEAAPAPVPAVDVEMPIVEAGPTVDVDIPIEEGAPTVDVDIPIEEGAPTVDVDIPIEEAAPAPAVDVEMQTVEAARAVDAEVPILKAAPLAEAVIPSLETGLPRVDVLASLFDAGHAPLAEAPVSTFESGPVPASEVPGPSLQAAAPTFELTFESQPVRPSPIAPTPARPSVERTSRPRLATESRRRAGEDLIGELFEIMHELHFAHDVAEGSEFVLSVLDELLPCEGVLIHVFDINTSHFVVVRAKGPNANAVLLQRMSDQDPLVRSVMRNTHAVSMNAAADARLTRHWQTLGVSPRAVLCGGVQLSGRYLGLIEVANPHGDIPFHQSELNALDYICEQFAAFLSKKPIVLSADVILSRR